MLLDSWIDSSWTVLNSDPVITKFKTLNKRNKADTIMTLDFSTLYIKISQKKLWKVIYEFLDFHFDAPEYTYVSVTKYKD